MEGCGRGELYAVGVTVKIRDLRKKEGGGTGEGDVGGSGRGELEADAHTPQRRFGTCTSEGDRGRGDDMKGCVRRITHMP